MAEERALAELHALQERKAKEKELEDAERERRRLAGEKVFKNGYEELEVTHERTMFEIAREERRIWEKILSAHRNTYHELRETALQQKCRKHQLQLSFASLQGSEISLLCTRFAVWRTFLDQRKEEKRIAEEEEKARREASRRRQEDAAREAHILAEEQEHKKKKSEEKYQDDCVAQSNIMVETGRPRGERVHDQKEQTKEKSGCCAVS